MAESGSIAEGLPVVFGSGPSQYGVVSAAQTATHRQRKGGKHSPDSPFESGISVLEGRVAVSAGRSPPLAPSENLTNPVNHGFCVELHHFKIPPASQKAFGGFTFVVSVLL